MDIVSIKYLVGDKAYLENITTFIDLMYII